MHYIGLTHDYHYRARCLHTWPAYFYHMCFHKSKPLKVAQMWLLMTVLRISDTASRSPRLPLATNIPNTPAMS